MRPPFELDLLRFAQSNKVISGDLTSGAVLWACASISPFTFHLPPFTHSGSGSGSVPSFAKLVQVYLQSANRTPLESLIKRRSARPRIFTSPAHQRFQYRNTSLTTPSSPNGPREYLSSETHLVCPVSYRVYMVQSCRKRAICQAYSFTRWVTFKQPWWTSSTIRWYCARSRRISR